MQAWPRVATLRSAAWRTRNLTKGADVVVDCSVRPGAPQADGTPNLLGPFTQGSAATRFVDVCVGRRAGQATSPWDGRVKVPLAGITQAQVKALLAASDTGLSYAVSLSRHHPPRLAGVRERLGRIFFEALGGSPAARLTRTRRIGWQ